MVQDLDIDHDRKTAALSDGLRGDQSLDDVPALIDEENEVMVMDRQHLGKLISGFGLVERSSPFPASIRKIDTIAFDYPGANFEVYELTDGSHVGLASGLLKSAVKFCLAAGKSSYDKDAFTLYRPTGSEGTGAAPFVLVSDYTPEEFVINRLFTTRHSFVSEFGAAACPECEKRFEDHFVDCPDCGHRPESVETNIHLIQEEHPGVIVAIAPRLVENEADEMQALESASVDPRPPLSEPDPDAADVEAAEAEE